MRASVEDVRFEAAEACVAATAAHGVADTVAEQAKALSVKVQAHDASLRSLVSRLEALEVSAQEGRAAGSAASVAGSSEAPSVPYERRQHAILANLGWGESPADLVERAVSVLGDANVARDSWSHLAPITSR